jgi:hypothetical protein
MGSLDIYRFERVVFVLVVLGRKGTDIQRGMERPTGTTTLVLNPQKAI